MNNTDVTHSIDPTDDSSKEPRDEIDLRNDFPNSVEDNEYPVELFPGRRRRRTAISSLLYSQPKNSSKKLKNMETPKSREHEDDDKEFEGSNVEKAETWRRPLINPLEDGVNLSDGVSLPVLRAQNKKKQSSTTTAVTTRPKLTNKNKPFTLKEQTSTDFHSTDTMKCDNNRDKNANLVNLDNKIDLGTSTGKSWNHHIKCKKEEECSFTERTVEDTGNYLKENCCSNTSRNTNQTTNKIKDSNSIFDCFNLLSLYAINRRLISRQRRSSPSHRARIAALSGCLYHIPPSVPGPPGALPEHTPVWAKLSHNMPAQPLSVKQKSFPWHLAKIIYVRPASGFCLGYIHQNGEVESLDDYLVEWAVGPSHLRSSLSVSATPTAFSTSSASVTRNQGLLPIERRPSTRHSGRPVSPEPRAFGGKDGDLRTSQSDCVELQSTLAAECPKSPASPQTHGKTNENDAQKVCPALCPSLGLHVIQPTGAMNDIDYSTILSETPPPLGHLTPLCTSPIPLSPQAADDQTVDELPPPLKKRRLSNNISSESRQKSLIHTDISSSDNSGIGPPYLACSPWHYEYYIHYQGFNRRYDRWCSLLELLPVFLDPRTLQLSVKGVARQLLSALNGVGHPYVSPKTQRMDASPTYQNVKISEKGTFSVANAVGLAMIRTLCTTFSDWSDGEDNDQFKYTRRTGQPILNSVNSCSKLTHKENCDSTESEDAFSVTSTTKHGRCDPNSANRIQTPRGILSWCLSFFSKARRYEETGKKRKKKVPALASSTINWGKLWWSIVVFAHLQIDIVEIQSALYSSAKKKRKYGNISHSSTGSSSALLSSCPIEHVLSALNGSCGISLHCLNDRNTPMTIKWKNLKRLEPVLTINTLDVLEQYPTKMLNRKNSVTHPCISSTDDDQMDVFSESPSAISIIGHQALEDEGEINEEPTPTSQTSRSTSSTGTISTTIVEGESGLSKLDISAYVLPEMSPRLYSQLNKILFAAVELANKRPFQRHASHSSDSGGDEPNNKPVSLNLTQNSSGLDCFDTVESDAGEHEGLDRSSIEAHESATKLRTIDSIQINHYVVPTWYYSPFPWTVQPTRCLFICAGCLEFFKYESEFKHHEQLCSRFTPPGDEIYRDGQLSFFEVDGEIEWAYCENLSLLSKLFLDHKTLQFSVTPFLFYVLIEWDDDFTTEKAKYSDDNYLGAQSALLRKAGLTPARNSRIVGYFSKEKESSMGYNLACILTLPHHQRKGYGKYFIHFSYALSKMEQKVGTPERPLSDLGRVSYSQYWKLILSEFLLSPADQPPACTCLFSEDTDALSTGLCGSTCCHFTSTDTTVNNEETNKTNGEHECSIKYMGEMSLSIEDFAHFTSIRKEDIAATLQSMGVLRRDLETDEYVLVFNKDWIMEIRKQCGRFPPAVLPENFVWAPVKTTLYQSPPNNSNPQAISIEPFTTIPSHNLESTAPLRKSFHFPNLQQCSHW